MGGGVALFTIDCLVVYRRRIDFEIDGFEFLWIEFSVKQRDFLCGVCYRPPDNVAASLSLFFLIIFN